MHFGEQDSVSNILESNRPPDGPPLCTPWGPHMNPAPQGKSLLGPPDPSCIPCPLGALQLSETPFPHPGGPDPSLSQLRTPGREGDNRTALASAADFPGGSQGRESACNARRPGFDPWVGKIPLEKGTHSTIMARRIPQTASAMGSQIQTWLSGLLVSATRLISRPYLHLSQEGHLLKGISCLTVG